MRQKIATLVLALLIVGGYATHGSPTRATPAAKRTASQAAKRSPAGSKGHVSRTPGGAASSPPRSAPFDSTMGDSVGEPRLYLSWGAPYGSPGARENLDVTCRDTTEVDTLYLSFETGRDLRGFYAMFARIYFHPAFGAALGPFWRYGHGDVNNGSLLIHMDPDASFPCSQPWIRPGGGVPRYEFRPELGELQLIYAVRPEDTVPVAGRSRYCYARLLLSQKNCQLWGARQPVCVEWTEAEYSGGGADIPITRGPGRFVSLNSPNGSVCTPYRRAARPPIWSPARTGPAGGTPPDTTRRPGAAPPDSTGR